MITASVAAAVSPAALQRTVSNYSSRNLTYVGEVHVSIYSVGQLVTLNVGDLYAKLSSFGFYLGSGNHAT
jgi:hypothetical protein